MSGKLTKPQLEVLRDAYCEKDKTINRVIGIHRPGNFKAMVARLVALGLLAHVGPDTVEITDAGRAALTRIEQ